MLRAFIKCDEIFLLSCHFVCVTHNVVTICALFLLYSWRWHSRCSYPLTCKWSTTATVMCALQWTHWDLHYWPTFWSVQNHVMTTPLCIMNRRWTNKRSHSDSSVLLIHKKLTSFTHKLSNSLIQHPYSTNHSVSLFHNKYRTWNRKIQTQQFLYCYSRKSDENCFCCGYLLYTITWGNFAEALWWVLMATHLWKTHIAVALKVLSVPFLWHLIANQPEHTHTFLFYWVFCE